LQAVPGVSQVTPIGGDVKQYQIFLSPQRLRAYDVTLAEVAEAVRKSNENVSAGFVVHGGEESIVQGVGRIASTDDIAATVVAMRDTRPVRVAQLGTVVIGAAIKRGIGAASRRGPNGEPITEPGVIIAVQKQPQANTITLTRQLDAVIDDIQQSLPEGMLINKRLFRQADFIDVAVNNTIDALRDGGIMAVLIVVAFLMSWRASFITVLAIPTSLIVACLTLKAFGSSINTMTLGGMAIAIGMLIDDALIDVENIVRRLRENHARSVDAQQPALAVVYAASIEVRASIVFATLIILLVFVPLFFLTDIEGRLLRPLGVAFVVSLGASLLVAVTLTPALSSYLLPSSREIGHKTETALVRLCKRMYGRPLDWALRHRRLVAIPTVLMFLAAVVGAIQAGRGFLPEFNEGALVIGLVSMPGISLAESDALATVAQETLMQHPEVATIGRRTGRAEEDEHVMGVEASEIEATLDMDAPTRLGLPRRTKAELLTALREDLAVIPGVEATIGQPIGHRIDHMLSGTRANIAVKIFGPDRATLRRIAKRAEARISDIPGAVDVSIEPQTEVPVLRVEFDRQAIGRYGLQVADVAAALETAYRGKLISQVLEGRNAFDLVLRVGDPDPAGRALIDTDPAAAGEVLVDTPTGVTIPLKALARIVDDERGPNMILRENVRRRIVVQCNVAGRDLGGVVRDIQRVVDEQLTLPKGYYVEYGGQFHNAETTRRRLAILGVLVVAGIGFLLHVAFRSGRDALLVMLNLPLALIGGVVGVYLAGGVISVASLIGFIGVFGIAARNGIMMLSHIRHLQRYEGVSDFREAVRRGAMERLAPILMTALSAGLALIPLAIGGDKPGREILTPMAMVILFGLLSATFLNMIVVPAMFLRFGRPVPPDDNNDAQLQLT
jgi:CzcA family heavy metal efflux pump